MLVLVSQIAGVTFLLSMAALAVLVVWLGVHA